ncbi:glucan biosynthesis protein [Desulfovibrio sp. OttesenSCG-928-O18]|nr:glucan biosynthesis protein [Desulfovibrio sp. OttesenSCG-928-O18]
MPLYSRSFRLQCGLLAAVLFFILTAALPVPEALAASKAASAPAPAVKAPEAAKDPFPEVIAKAKRRASRSYKDAEGMAPDFLRTLTENQWNGIRFKPEQAIWRQLNLPFEIELYHPGFIFTRTVDIHIVSPTGTEGLTFSPEMFAYGNKALVDKIKQNPPGFAGFRIMHPLNGPYSRDVVTSFLGASYFRGMGKHSRPGLYARALALNTALPDGEEFPLFREFWFVTPKADDKTLVVCALMDSPSMAGAYRFAITPGTSTVMDVEARIFPRKNSGKPQKIGMAPLTSMFLYAEAGNGWPGEYRPEVHNSDGLLFSSGENAWTWSPLANPSRLAINTFPMENPRGFGLMQRDNNFDHYQDMEARFDQKPSVWVEPQGDWGPGRIELIEIPSTEEIHDNIIAFWVPDPATAVGSSEDTGALSYAYKLFWMTPGVTPHALGRVTATRIVKRSDTARFIIDFESEALKALPAETGLTSLIETPESAPIIEKQLAKNAATGGWRLYFSVRLPRQDSVVQSIISAREGSPRLRFRALLKKGENLPDPLTEEWVYDLPS